jgi:hypothetical protein
VEKEGEMRDRKGVIEFICEGGSGSEASVKVELRSEFPGIGGTIVTYEGVATALRAEYSPRSKSGHRMFLRHMIIKKLEDYFFRTGVYMFAHIPRPLGSVSREGESPYEAYLYEWAFGSDGFPWVYLDAEGNRSPIKLHDWSNFVMSFASAGIDVAMDCADPDDGRISQNVIHQYAKPIAGGSELNSLWKRIDFGSRSVNVDFEKLSDFLRGSRGDLIDVLRYERYEMLVLAVEYLTKGRKTTDVDIGRLDALVGDYRRASLSHYTSRGSGRADKPVYISARTESLI